MESPGLVRKPFEKGVVEVLSKHKRQILEETPDWTDIRVSGGTPIGLAGWPRSA